jgi:tetratricopeptide (TPR) repeat protein
VSNRELANSFKITSVGFQTLGLGAESLEAARECVALYRNVAADKPNSFNPELAEALDNLSSCLSGCGHRAEAIKAASECAGVYRTLATREPRVFRPKLAEALQSIFRCASRIDQQPMAIAAARESVALYGDLARESPSEFDEKLAVAIDALIHGLSAHSDFKTALEVARVPLIVGFAVDTSHVFNRRLGAVLNSFLWRLTGEERLEAQRRQVAVYRQLAGARPHVYTVQFAEALESLRDWSNDGEEVLEAGRGCVILYRDLARDTPGVFDSRLAVVLSGLCMRLSQFGHHEEALGVAHEAVALYRDLAKDTPSNFFAQSDLDTAFKDLIDCLLKLGHLEKALEAVHESVTVFRDLARVAPSVFNAQLGGVFAVLIDRLSELGHLETALGSMREYVELYRDFANNVPDVFNDQLVTAFETLIHRLSNLDHKERALEVAHECVALYRGLTRDTRVSVRHLAAALKILSKHLSELGRHQEALEAAGESADLYRHVPKISAFESSFAGEFWDIFDHLLTLRDVDKALLVAREYVTRYGRDDDTDDWSFLYDWSRWRCDRKFSSRLSVMGYPKLALEVIQLSFPPPLNQEYYFGNEVLQTISDCIRALRDQNEPEGVEILLDMWDRCEDRDDLRRSFNHFSRVETEVQACRDQFRSVKKLQIVKRASGLRPGQRTIERAVETGESMSGATDLVVRSKHNQIRNQPHRILEAHGRA